MTIDDMVKGLCSKENQNEELSSLYQILVETRRDLVDSLSKIIDRPKDIENTNGFANILEYICSEEFIEPLLKVLQYTNLDDAWLHDYMYAFYMILEEKEKNIDVEDVFVHKLGEWLLHTEGGLHSCDAANVLEHVLNEACCTYMVQGLQDKSLFFLSRLACLRWLVNNRSDLASKLIDEMNNEEDKELKKQILSARKYLNKYKKQWNGA